MDSDGTPLAYEIEEWNTGGSFVWVKVPQIDAGSTTDSIWMYYDNGSVGDAENPADVWSEGYVGVWHMDQNPGASQILDSTLIPNHGTASNMDLTNLQIGRVGDGLYFDGSASPNAEYIRVPSDGTDELSITGTSLTLEGWVERTGAPGGWMVIVGRQFGAASGDSYTLVTKYDEPSRLHMVTGSDVLAENLPAAVPVDANWHYAVGVVDGDVMNLYSDGSPDGQIPSGVAPIATDPNDVTIGAQENDATLDPTEPWQGRMDEIRISNVPRSADWVNAQHASMTDTFAAYGSEEEAGVLANDTDPESQSMTAVLVAGPAHAAVFALNPDGSFNYTPAAGMSGTDSFTYVANDGTGDSNVATVTITVTATGPNSPPTAVDDPLAATNQDVALVIDVLANDTDPDPDTLTVNSVTQGTNGAVVNNGGTNVTYTPDALWTGVDTFTYEASDGNGGFDTATVTVTVSAAGNTPPTAVDDPSAATTQDTPVVIDVLANDTDPDPDTLTVSSVTQGTNGSVVNNTSDVTYAPNALWTGVDTFTYEASDGNGGFDTATVTVTVSAAANNPPVAVDDSDSTVVDTAVVVDVLANDSDPDTDPLSVDSVTQGADGSVVNNTTNVTYTPNASWTGIDTFTYTVADGNGGFDTATVTVTVTANLAPTAVAGGPYGIAEGNDDLVLDGSGSSDPDLDTLTYRWDLNNDLTYGDVTGVNPTVTWATLGIFGIDDDGGPLTIGLEVDDGNGNTATDTAQLTVTNTPPTISVTGTGAARGRGRLLGQPVGVRSGSRHRHWMDDQLGRRTDRYHRRESGHRQPHLHPAWVHLQHPRLSHRRGQPREPPMAPGSAHRAGDLPPLTALPPRSYYRGDRR